VVALNPLGSYLYGDYRVYDADGGNLQQVLGGIFSQ